MTSCPTSNPSVSKVLFKYSSTVCSTEYDEPTGSSRLSIKNTVTTTPPALGSAPTMLEGREEMLPIAELVDELLQVNHVLMMALDPGAAGMTCSRVMRRENRPL